MMRTSHCLIRLLVFVGLFFAGVHADSRQPNIVLILADDVGREVLGCYGGTSYQTPNIDRLAASGARFEHAYVMPVCHPTRTTLLTGQYPFRLGHPEWGSFPRDVENRTLANVVKRAGYATAIAGKWQLALLKDDLQQPHRMGFDEYCLYGWHEGPWYYQPHLWQNGKLRTDVRDRYGPDVVCDYLIDFIERSRSQPFFAFYSMELCHSETNDLDQPAPLGPHGRYDSFAEMVARMDDRVERVVSAIDRLGLRENTLIIYVADNGTAEHHLIRAVGKDYIYEKNISKMGDREIVGGKATLTDRGTRVPLILNWPGTIESGKVSSDLIDGSDFLPTLAKVAGARLPTDVALDGHVMPMFAPQDSMPRSWVFAEYRNRCFVRNRDWKLYNDGSFYDMEADSEEKLALARESLSSPASAAALELQQALERLAYVPKRK